MSGVAVVQYLLAHNGAVTAVVAAANIKAGDIPLNTALPALGVRQIGGQQRLTVAMSETKKMHTERVQVTVQAKTYADQKSILALVRTACANRNGAVNGVDLDSILPDTEGPDLSQSDASIYEQGQDFIVKYRV